jgi:hypothetical protein
VLKVAVTLVFVLFADGKPAAGTPDAGKAVVAADRSAPEESGKKPGKPVEAGKEAGKETGKEAGKEPGKDGKAPAKDLAHAGKKGAPGKADGDRVATPPPGISATAMNEEMNTRAAQQKALTERERLESLSSDLSRTRSALREETVRLETLMEMAKQAGAKPGAAAPGAGAAGKPAGQGANTAAPSEGPRTEGGPMPIGDPLQPSAYYRPAPPPPNFAVQVEVVSKAMKSMKPEQAAGILGHLERGLAAEVLQRMRPADAGAILGFLKPEVGAALAAEIVSRPPVRAKDKDSDKDKP